MSTQLNDLAILEQEFSEVKGRVSTAMRALDELVEVNAQFSDLSETYARWKAHAEAWPPLEEKAESAVKVCQSATDELDHRFAELLEQTRNAVSDHIAELRDQLFATVDNAKADYANRLNAHRSEIERSISVLRNDFEGRMEGFEDRLVAADQAVASLQELFESRQRELEGRILDLDQRSRDGIQGCERRISAHDSRILSLSRHVWVLWAGIVGTLLLSLLIGRIL